MSREKSVWFAEEILLDAKLINCQLETGEWSAVEEMLRAEAQLSRDSETGRLRPKKASEYTLRLIAEVLHIMKLDVGQGSYNISTLAVAEQCLRLIRSCAASGMKIQTYISKDLSILDDMLTIFTEYQQPSEEVVNEELSKKFESCMVALTQTLGNLVVNNPFNQTIIWEKFGSNILNALLGHNEKIASCAAMIVYNILLGQPNVLPDDVLLLNALAYMYSEGNSEFPHLIIEYLIGVENSYIEKLYNRLEPDTKLLILNLAYNILMSLETQDINVSVNFIKFIAHEFKMKSDCILKTVDKYVNSIEPQEVVFLLDIIATASSMEVYMDCLQSDVSLFINCAFLLRSIHELGKYEDNFFTSIKKLYQTTGKKVPDEPKIAEDVANTPEKGQSVEEHASVKKCDSSDMLLGTETVSECTESECSEQYFECTESLFMDKIEPQIISENLQTQMIFIENKLSDVEPIIPPVILPEPVGGFTFPRQGSADRKISDVSKLDENLIKVAFSKNIIPDSNHVGTPGEVNNLGPNTSFLGGGIEPTAQTDKRLDRKISLDHKIDILDEMEPPLITDSPEESAVVTLKANTPNLSRGSSVETVRERTDSITVDGSIYGTKSQSNPATPFNMSRQQSVEPGIEASETVIREMAIDCNYPEQTTESIQNVNTQVVDVQKAEANHVTSFTEPLVFNPNNVEIEVPTNTIITQPKVASEPIPVKKSQNLSTEFDLSEQLQKILGISADKANLRTDSLDLSKDTHSVQTSIAKPELPQPLSQSVNLPPAPPQSAEPPVQKPRVQVKVPNVKIDSPENNLKAKLGNFEHTGPKKLASVTETVEQHVAFGFKGTVIRTLGNLCWKNQPNKRQIRELEIIPILLDCCNIDARNPLIMQWVILAVRNLCENCPENQAVIASLTLQEPVDNEVLTEMGLTLHTDAENNSIKIVPLMK